MSIGQGEGIVAVLWHTGQCFAALGVGGIREDDMGGTLFAVCQAGEFI
jgi:hypothetical protein